LLVRFGRKMLDLVIQVCAGVNAGVSAGRTTRIPETGQLGRDRAGRDNDNRGREPGDEAAGGSGAWCRKLWARTN